MTRRSHLVEFKRAVRREVFARAYDPTLDVYRCEACNAVLKPGEGEVDHILPVELGGEPTVGNARLLCKTCHKAKSADDIGRIRKGDRQRDKHTGAIRPVASIRTAPFPRSPKSIRRNRRASDRADLAALAARFNPALGVRS